MLLITGHTGFVGSHLTQHLKQRNIPFLGYSLDNGQDIRNMYELDQTFRYNSIDTVIHLAARAGVRQSKAFPEEYVTTNISGTQNVINCCEKYNVKKLIAFSTSSVYGNGTPPNKETDPISPQSVYTMTKAALESLCEITSVPTVVVRPFTIYGEHGRRDQVLYTWINQIKDGKPITFYGDGSSKRGYTYVGDLCEGVIALLNRTQTANHAVYNLGGNEITTLAHLLALFQEHIPGLRINMLPRAKEDLAENWADISKARRELGFEPKTAFVDKIKEILHTELPQYIWRR